MGMVLSEKVKEKLGHKPESIALLEGLEPDQLLPGVGTAVLIVECDSMDLAERKETVGAVVTELRDRQIPGLEVTAGRGSSLSFGVRGPAGAMVQAMEHDAVKRVIIDGFMFRGATAPDAEGQSAAGGMGGL